MARRLSDIGLSASVVRSSLRDYHIKVHVAYGLQDLGHLRITTGRKGSKYQTHEMKGPDIDQVLKQCWYGGAVADAQRELDAAFSAPDLAGIIPHHAYVDGSFDNKYGCGGYGAVLLERGEVIDEIAGVVSDPESRNIDGEMEAVLQVLAWCAEHDVDRLVIHYDYVGLSAWVKGSWKTKHDGAKAYVRQVRQSGIEITWSKIEAHSGDHWNDRADKLAKDAILACIVP